MTHFLQPKRLPAPLMDALAHTLRSRACAHSSIGLRQFSQSPRALATVGLDALDRAKGDRERIVILGSGWAGRSPNPISIHTFNLAIN